jgi:CheY-like chemotaxis protein
VSGCARNYFAIRVVTTQHLLVTSPLALVFYEDLIPGTQLVNRLQDLKYRVQAVSDLTQLTAHAAEAGTMFILADLSSKQGNVSEVISKLYADKATAHIPVIAFADEGEEALQNAARTAGAKLVVTDAAILSHLQQFIEQALQVD